MKIRTSFYHQELSFHRFRVSTKILRVTRRATFHQALRSFSADKTNISQAKSWRMHKNLDHRLSKPIMHAWSISPFPLSRVCPINNDAIRPTILFQH